MVEYQDEFRRILDEEVSDYAAQAIGRRSSGRAGGGGHKHARWRLVVGISAGSCAWGGRLGVAQSPRNTF